GAAEQALVAVGIVRRRELDVHFPEPRCASRQLHGKLPAGGEGGVDHEEVEAVVGTDRIETGGRWMKAGVATVVLAGQALEAHQYIEGLAQVGRALGGQTRQSQVRWLAVPAHQQADVLTAAEL